MALILEQTMRSRKPARRGRRGWRWDAGFLQLMAYAAGESSPCLSEERPVRMMSPDDQFVRLGAWLPQRPDLRYQELRSIWPLGLHPNRKSRKPSRSPSIKCRSASTASSGSVLQTNASLFRTRWLGCIVFARRSARLRVFNCQASGSVLLANQNPKARSSSRCACGFCSATSSLISHRRVRRCSISSSSFSLVLQIPNPMSLGPAPILASCPGKETLHHVRPLRLGAPGKQAQQVSG